MNNKLENNGLDGDKIVFKKLEWYEIAAANKWHKQCKLPGIVGNKLPIILLHSSILQSTWHGSTENFGDDRGKPETTLPTYWSPAASYRK